MTGQGVEHQLVEEAAQGDAPLAGARAGASAPVPDGVLPGYFRTCTSTRRFWPRPSYEVLLATGFRSP